MSDPCLNWEKRMTSQEAAKHHLTGGLVAVELYRAAVADADALRRQLAQAQEQIAALKADLAGVSETVGWASTLLDLSTRTINEMWANKAKAAEAWENLKYWRGLITWDSRVGGGDGKELDRLKAYFAEETEHGDTGVR